MNYCNNCATKLEIAPNSKEWHCPSCENHYYSNPLPTVDALLFNEEGEMLLGRRNRPPRKGKLNLPGGFIEINETLEEALQRELSEELSLTPSDYSNLTYGNSRVDRYPHNGEKRYLLSFIMVGKIAKKDFPPNDEVDEYLWVKPNDLRPDELTTIAEYKSIVELLNNT